MRKIKFVFIFILASCFITDVFAQSKLVYEQVDGKSYILNFKNSVNYENEMNNGKNIIKFYEFKDESKSGHLNLPSNDLIVALPVVEKPKVLFNIVNSKTIDAIPEFNPKVVEKDGEIYYEQPAEYMNSVKEKYIIKGFFWIQNKYCMHITVNPFSFNVQNNSTNFIEEFQLELKFKSEIQNFKNVNNPSNLLTINSVSESINEYKYYQSTDSIDWIDYSGEYLKIGVATDGIYRLQIYDLQNNGIDVNIIDPTTFKLFMRGDEIPIYVSGEKDYLFDDNDFIEFFGRRNMGGKHREVSLDGEPYNEYLGRYTDTTVYWLTWGGSKGKRVDLVIPNNEVVTDTLEYYSEINHFEENIWFDHSNANLINRELPFWDKNKTWGHNWIGVGITNKKFEAKNIYPNGTASLFIKLQDFSSDIIEKAHLFALSLNSQAEKYDSTYINKYEHVVLQADVPSIQLQEGNNILNIHSYKTDANLNNCFFDWFEIEYPRYLIPYEDSLKFSFPFIKDSDVKIIKIMEVNSNSVSLWRYNQSYKKYIVENNSNEVVFSDTISSHDKFFFTDESKILSPKIYYKKQFKNLRNNENKSDYLLITHRKFQTLATEYAAFISSNYNIDAKVIDIYDIYDEYSYGFFNPEAIREFLKSTHVYWQEPKPKNVFLVGAATYDYYNNRYYASEAIEEKVINYVPSFGAPVSDNWFVVWDTTGANIPQLNIGRLPIKSNEEFQWYFEKHRNYVDLEFDAWNKKYLFFSGGNEKNESEMNQLKSTNDFIIENYTNLPPIGGKADHFYKTINPNSNFGPYTTDYFNNSISEGSVFISYIGHSGTQTWDNSIISPSQLKNDRNKYPIVSDFGCSTGKFAEPDITSFSQLFTLDSDGQALAYIGNTSLGFLSTSLLMPKLFYKKILEEGINNVSEAHRQAKIEMLTTYGSSGVYQLFSLTNTLIGDPIITLPIPNQPNFVIKDDNLTILSENYSDLTNNVLIEIELFNYGKVLSDSITISAIHSYLMEVDSTTLKVKMPNYSTKITTSLIVKNKPGRHSLQIYLDSDGKFDEIYENDNSGILNFYVASSKYRPLVEYNSENGFSGIIKYLNPILKSEEQLVKLEYSNFKSFDQKNTIELEMDPLISTIQIPDLSENDRYWFRTKNRNSDLYSSVFSVNTSSSSKFLLVDSLSFSNSEFIKLKKQNGVVSLDTSKVHFNVLSAGFSDGNTVLIEKNLINYVFDGTLRGHYVSVFEDSSYNFLDSKVFDLLGGGETTRNEYFNFLDTLSNENIVIFAIKDEGSINLTDKIREKIKEFGSSLIDSVGFRSSWVLFGKRGVSSGSMPEAYSNEGEGFVEIDTTIFQLNRVGNFNTINIGPSSHWKSISVNESLPSNSKITYKPIILSQDDNSSDTLEALTIKNGEGSLKHIDAKKYPYLKILAEFEAGENNTSPELYSLGVDYVGIPELAINYQVVSLEKDTLQQGEDVNLNFYVYNVGESAADSFNVTVDMVNPDNSKQRIYSTLVDSLGSEQRKKFEVSYNTTSFNGERSLEISIDGDNNVTELFEDNNYYNIPFYVKGDTTKPSMQLTIDGNDIFEGEYISSNPNIKIELSDPSLIPITDTSSISVFLNNRYINYLGNEENIKINFSEMNPKVTVNFTPKLEDGEYTLRVFGKDASGNVGDSAGITKYFNVSNDPKLLQVYNYPNPFSSDTYFTFKLTQIPDDIKIKIFTVAGRLIREISRNSSQLNYDLNKIYWNGRDNDGDLLGNGVYLYKVIMNVNGKKTDITQKLAVVR